MGNQQSHTFRPFSGNIKELTMTNNDFRMVLYTVPNLQLVLMSLDPEEDIPMEVHKKTTQFIRIEKGTGVAIVNKFHHKLTDGSSIVIPPNTPHRIINTSKTDKLKLYTIYAACSPDEFHRVDDDI